MFGYDWSVILPAMPWFALAGWVANDGEKDMSGRFKFVMALTWGVITTLVFFWALSAISASFPWNVIAIVVGFVLSTAVAVSPFVFVWRLISRRTRPAR